MDLGHTDTGTRTPQSTHGPPHVQSLTDALAKHTAKDKVASSGASTSSDGMRSEHVIPSPHTGQTGAASMHSMSAEAPHTHAPDVDPVEEVSTAGNTEANVHNIQEQSDSNNAENNNETESSVANTNSNAMEGRATPPQALTSGKADLFAHSGADHRLMETFKGYISTPHDALLVFEACRLSYLSRVQRRLSESERFVFVRPGAVFVWDEEESGIKRWTDGRHWSPSRINGSFLIYREVEPRKRIGTGAASITSAGSAATGDEKIEYVIKEDGLTKKAISITTSTGNKQHLISYYSRDYLQRDPQKRPCNLPMFMQMVIPPNIYPDHILDNASTTSSNTNQNPSVNGTDAMSNSRNSVGSTSSRDPSVMTYPYENGHSYHRGHHGSHHHGSPHHSHQPHMYSSPHNHHGGHPHSTNGSIDCCSNSGSSYQYQPPPHPHGEHRMGPHHPPYNNAAGGGYGGYPPGTYNPYSNRNPSVDYRSAHSSTASSRYAPSFSQISHHSDHSSNSGHHSHHHPPSHHSSHHHGHHHHSNSSNNHQTYPRHGSQPPSSLGGPSGHNGERTSTGSNGKPVVSSSAVSVTSGSSSVHRSKHDITTANSSNYPPEHMSHHSHSSHHSHHMEHPGYYHGPPHGHHAPMHHQPYHPMNSYGGPISPPGGGYEHPHHYPPYSAQHMGPGPFPYGYSSGPHGPPHGPPQPHHEGPRNGGRPLTNGSAVSSSSASMASSNSSLRRRREIEYQQQMHGGDGHEYDERMRIKAEEERRQHPRHEEIEDDDMQMDRDDRVAEKERLLTDGKHGVDINDDDRMASE